LQVAGRRSQVAGLILTASLCVSMFTSCKDDTMNEVSNTVQKESAKKSDKFFKWDVNEKTEMPAFQTKNGRLVFKNSFDFLQATRFAKQYPVEVMLKFQKQAGYQSLYQYKLATVEDGFNLSDFPAGYADMLNQKGEIQVGDTLVCYAADGFKYFIPDGDENLLANITTNPAAIPLKYEYRPKQVSLLTGSWDAKGVKQTQNRQFSPNSIDARYQRVYYVNGEAGSKRKIVYEMAFFRDNWWGYSSYVSQTKLKLEWWSNGSNSWQPAGETRTKTITNLNAQTTVYNNGQPFDWNVYSSPSITLVDGGDLTQSLLQGWAWGGLDYAWIDSGAGSGTVYESYVNQDSHKNFGGRYIENAWW
jgi:hypothetical protein